MIIGAPPKALLALDSHYEDQAFYGKSIGALTQDRANFPLQLALLLLSKLTSVRFERTYHFLRASFCTLICVITYTRTKFQISEVSQ